MRLKVTYPTLAIKLKKKIRYTKSRSVKKSDCKYHGQNQVPER